MEETRTFGVFRERFQLEGFTRHGVLLSSCVFPPGRYELRSEERDTGPEGTNEAWCFLRGTELGFRRSRLPEALSTIEVITESEAKGRIERLLASVPDSLAADASNRALRGQYARQSSIAGELCAYLRFTDEGAHDGALQTLRAWSVESACLSGQRLLAVALADRYLHERGTPHAVAGEWFWDAWFSRIPTVGRRLIVGYEALLHAVLDQAPDAHDDLAVALFLPLHAQSWTLHPEEHASAQHPLYVLVPDEAVRERARIAIRQVLTVAANEKRVLWAHPERGMDRNALRTWLDNGQFAGRPEAPEPVLVSDLVFWHGLADLMGPFWESSVRLTVI